jgi:cephalosporin hydroxylase
MTSLLKTGTHRARPFVRSARRAVVKRVDEFVVRRAAVLDQRTSTAARDRRTVAALAELTPRVGRNGKFPKGFQAAVTDAFSRMYHYKGTWDNTYFLGTRVLKNPLDLWIYQELLYEVRPDVVVECGTNRGGSALFLARLFDLMGHGRVVTIDIALPPDTTAQMLPKHPRITYVTGSSTDPEIVEGVCATIAPEEKVLVILDSSHWQHHVQRELQAWAPKVSVGSYLIVEDTVLSGHPVGDPKATHPRAGHDIEGPMEAVQEFLAGRSDFAVDRSREKFLHTYNRNGYLRRLW